MGLILPWLRQPYDTEQSWAFFESYRDQIPPRRLFSTRVGVMNVNPIVLAQWHHDCYWEERCSEYDRHLDSIVIRERELLLTQKTRDVQAQHMETLASARSIVTREFSKLAATVQAHQMETLKPRDLIRLMETTIKLDRLIRGESTENVSETTQELAHLTDEELEAISTMLEKTPDGGTPTPTSH